MILNSSRFHSWFESHRIWAGGLVVGELCETPSHWRQTRTLSAWMKEQNIPGICGIDTRALTKIIREKGSILGRIVINSSAPTPEQPLPSLEDPNKKNLVAEVSIQVSSFLNDEFVKPTHVRILHYSLSETCHVQSGRQSSNLRR